ncbi:MAG: hypothetical protein JXR49_10540 [Acidobacteria bacterium]|nr:hypothetical protein [Acidobacteriota bacterium]
MQSPVPDLRKLAQFYSDLQKDLSDVLNEGDSGNERSLTESILENKSRISQIERMHAHILQLSDNLKKSYKDLNSGTRAEAEALASEARSHAVHIRELCTQASEKIEKTKVGIQKELEGIAKGKQYLKSAAPVKTNFPKFIDSTG